jgi:hypothetical protein
VGVKWTWWRGRFASQWRISLVLWIAALSRTKWISRSGGTLASTSSRNRRNSAAREAPADHRSRPDVQGREQARGAVAGVVVGAALHLGLLHGLLKIAG